MAEHTPLFRHVFADSWDALPPVFLKRYAHRGGSRDTVVLTGVMQFRASRLARLLSPILRLRGMPPMFSATDVPVTLRITGQGESATLHLAREFSPQDRRKPVRFDTLVQPAATDEVIGWARGAVGWVASYRYQEQTVRMAHRGYRGRLFGRTFRLPLEKFIGTCNAWERAENDNRISMRLEMRRPDGKLFYGYSGVFDVAGVLRKD